MDTCEKEDKALSLEETLQLLDAYPIRLSQPEELLDPVSSDPDPAAIDAAMQMLVESGWTFEDVETSPFDADAVAVSTSSACTTAASPRRATTASRSPSTDRSPPVPVSAMPTPTGIPVLHDIDMLLSHQRGRKREQLIQLRAVAQALEGRLQQLRTASLMRAGTSDATAQSDQAAATHDTRVWQQIAERQYEARCRVEQENARLRASLHAQIEVARRLERLLKKQQPSNLP